MSKGKSANKGGGKAPVAPGTPVGHVDAPLVPPTPFQLLPPLNGAPAAPPALEVRALPELTLSLPWIHGPGYCSRIIEMTLTQRQTIALRALRDGLTQSDARLMQNGRFVRNGLDVVRVVLDRTADKLNLGPNGEVPEEKRGA